MRRVLLVYDLYMDGRRNALGGYELGMRLCDIVWRAVRGAAAATAAAWLCSCAAQIAHVDGGDAESQRAERVECQTSASASADVGDYGAASFNRAGWLTDFGKSSVRLSEIVSGGVGRDQIRPIDEPQSVPVSEAGRMFESDEAVIALEVGGERRAYPLSILIWREIVNDEIGGTPVAVTYCPLCNSAVVFDARVGGRALDFGTTGNLRGSDMVMWDRQTETWWQQITGEAIVGELTGSRLKTIPSAVVSWRQFRSAYPDGSALSGDAGMDMDYDSPIYGGYDQPGGKPQLFAGEIDGRLDAMERVLGVTVCGARVAYPFSLFADRPVVNDEIGEQGVALMFERRTLSPFTYYGDEPVHRIVGSATAFRSSVDGRALTFASEGREIVDVETGSTWNALGEAVDGPLKGRRLTLLEQGSHFWFAWAAFHPDTLLREAADLH